MAQAAGEATGGSSDRGIGGVPYKYLVVAAFSIGLFMDIMDATIVNVALPVLGKDFHAGTPARSSG